MKLRHLPVALVGLMLLSPSVPVLSADDSPVMMVVVDKRTGQYHVGSCPKIGSNVQTATVVEASERHRACPICSPVNAALAEAKMAAAIEGTRSAAFAAQKVAKAAADAAAAVTAESSAPASVAATPATAGTVSAVGGGSSSDSRGGTVQVKGYTRKDGTYVRPHTRKKPRS